MIAVIALALLAAPQDTTGMLSLDPQVRHGRLENGLAWYVKVNRLPEHRAELRLVVNAGSVLEDDDQRGLAHFVEHMAFNGTRRFPRQALVDFIEGLGMRFGAHLNASTSFDETIYELQVPTDSAGILPRALDILEDWAHGVTLDSAEIERERGVVVEEWRLGLGAEARMLDRQLPVLFSGSRYAERLPIGDRRTLETAPREALTRFYRDWYRPDLMAVIVVGDVNPDSVERLIRERFSRLASPASARARPATPVPFADTTLVAVATDPEATGSRVTVGWLGPVDRDGSAARWRRDLVGQLHDLMLNLRLGELTRRENPPFIGAGAGRGRFVREAEVLSLGAAVPDGGLARGLEAAVLEAERARRHGFTPGELDRARQEYLRAYERAFAERDKTRSGVLVGELVRHFLEGTPAPGIAAEYEMARTFLPGITLDEVNRVASEAAGERGRIVLVNAPEKAGLEPPDGRALLAVLDQAAGAEVTAYADEVADLPLVPDPPAPGSIVSERRDSLLGTVEWVLGNGARVILKPTDFKDDEVVMTAWSPGGSSLAPEAVHFSAAFSPTLLGVGGLGAFDATGLQKRLAGVVAQVDPTITATQEGLSGSASPRDLETFFQLIYLTMTAPRADTTAFRAFQSNARAALANRGASPQAVFSDSLTVTVTQHHPRTRPITPGLVDSLDLGAAWAFYRDRFADAGDFTFVFVGSFTLDAIRPLAARWLGGLPALRRTETWRDLGITAPRGVVERTVRKGLEPQSLTQLLFTGPFEYTRPNRAALRGLASVLELRLREVLREALGATYGVNVTGSASRVPRTEYTFGISFGSAPERADELVRAVFAEIDSLRAGGPRAGDLAKVAEAEVRARETNLRQNGWWLSQLAFLAQSGEPGGPVVDPRGDAALLTAEAIHQAARRWLDPANYIRVTLLPEERTP